MKSNDLDHICTILKQIREVFKRACIESKKARKEAFRYLLHHHDVLNISHGLNLNDSILSSDNRNDNNCTIKQKRDEDQKSKDFVDRLSELGSDKVSF